MNLVRFVGRTFFSSYFVADGYQSVMQPDRYVDEVTRTLDSVLPKVRAHLPEKLAERLPHDMRTWTRIIGGLQVVAGAGYALGILRRPSAFLLALATLPHVVGTMPSRKFSRADRERIRGQFLKNLALFGAAVIATHDLEGRPSLSYRISNELPRHVDHGMTLLSKEAQLAKAQLTNQIHDAQSSARKTLLKAKDAVVS